MADQKADVGKAALEVIPVGRAPPPGKAPPGPTRRLRELIEEGDGDHILLLKAYLEWEAAGGCGPLCPLLTLRTACAGQPVTPAHISAVLMP